MPVWEKAQVDGQLVLFLPSQLFSWPGLVQFVQRLEKVEKFKCFLDTGVKILGFPV